MLGQSKDSPEMEGDFLVRRLGSRKGTKETLYHDWDGGGDW